MRDRSYVSDNARDAWYKLEARPDKPEKPGQVRTHTHTHTHTHAHTHTHTMAFVARIDVDLGRACLLLRRATCVS